MKRNLFLTASIVSGAFLLTATMSLAKDKTAAKHTPPPTATANRSSSHQSHHGQAPGIAVDHPGGNTPRAKPKSGENPLFESKDKTAAKNKPVVKTSPKSSSAEYKDPEDMTTRYRPGNNKTKAAKAKADSKKAKAHSATARHQ